jgi:hypothetical protein
MNWNGLGRKRSWPDRGTISVFACRDKGKPRKLIRIADDPAEIRTDITATLTRSVSTL